MRPLASPPAPARARRVALALFGLGPGGAEKVAAALAGWWAREGREVAVVTVASAAADVHALAPGVERVALDLAADSAGPLEAAARSLRRAAALRRTLLRLAPDVVVSLMPQTSALALLAARGTRLPVVACERTDPRHAALPPAWRLLRRALYPRAAAVAVQTEAVAGWARAFCPRVRVVPNFVERPPRLAGPLDGPGPKRLVALGRLVPAKGFDLLLEAFARVAPARPGWSLTIYGEGPERPRLEAAAAALGLSGRASFPGRVGDPLARLADAHAFALPSRLEGFPNALLEAMACGLPVVACDCPSGPAEVIAPGRDGLLVPPGDPAALAAALARLMDRPAERVRLGERAREVADRFGPARVLPRWAALLEEACGRTG